MSTPAVSAAIRRLDGGRAQGGIVLTASHNPGGPGEDFGIKYNEGFGQPAGEEFTDKLYEKSLKITSFRTVEETDDIYLSSDVGSVFSLTETSTVTIIDPFESYLEALRSCFDFDGLREFVKRDGFSVLFDGMHGAGGPFARRVLFEELGLPEVSSFSDLYYILNCFSNWAHSRIDTFLCSRGNGGGDCFNHRISGNPFFFLHVFEN